jgi:hypothetical protein
MQDPYTAYQYKIKKGNFGCAEHKLHGEEGLTRSSSSSSLLGRWSATAMSTERWPVVAAPVGLKSQHATRQKRREQSSDEFFFAAEKEVKVIGGEADLGRGEAASERTCRARRRPPGGSPPVAWR